MNKKSYDEDESIGFSKYIIIDSSLYHNLNTAAISDISLFPYNNFSLFYVMNKVTLFLIIK